MVLTEGVALMGKRNRMLEMTIVRRLGLKHFVLEASIVAAGSRLAF